MEKLNEKVIKEFKFPPVQMSNVIMLLNLCLVIVVNLIMILNLR